MVRCPILLLVPTALAAPTCGKVDEGVCLTKAKPILETIKNTTDTDACCAACLANPECVAWNVNSKHDICYLRAVYVSNPGDQCKSGKVRDGPSPSPTPPPPSPPPPTPPPVPVPPSDQRPQFHFMPYSGFTNDIQGPFYDPNHELYHMGFAWHPDSPTFGGAPNRWYHIVSKDLARWQIVSTSPDKAMIKPGNYTDADGEMYCDHKPTTGSVTIVDGKPRALFSCKGSGTGTTIASASPAALDSDPLLTDWDMNAANPVIGPDVFKGGRDPSTAWKSKGLWRTVSTCGDQCSKNKSTAASVYSSEDFVHWEFTGALYDWDTNMMECPDFYEATAAPGSEAKLAAAPLHVLKYSWKHTEFVIVGRYDEDKQRLVDLVADPQILDKNLYASKSFWDPVNEQQVWSGWLGEKWHADGGGCANLTVCSTHSLPRAMQWDAELNRMITPPIPQLELLRGRQLASLSQTVMKDGAMQLLHGVRGMQLEIIATFALPAAAGTSTVGIATRMNSDISQSSNCSVTFNADGAGGATLNVTIKNQGAIVDTPARRGDVHWQELPLKASDKQMELRCFVDHSVIEAYGSGGRTAVSARSYPLDDAVDVGIFASGADARLLSLRAFEMDSIWIDHVLESTVNLV